MNIGESATVPSMVPVRVPGRDQAPYQTRTVMTLRAIDMIDVNLDRGFVTAITTEWTFTGTYPEGRGAGLGQPMRATFKVTVTAKE